MSGAVGLASVDDDAEPRGVDIALVALNCASAALMSSAVIEKPMPIEPLSGVGEAMAVFMPMTSPSMLISSAARIAVVNRRVGLQLLDVDAAASHAQPADLAVGRGEGAGPEGDSPSRSRSGPRRAFYCRPGRRNGPAALFRGQLQKIAMSLLWLKAKTLDLAGAAVRANSIFKTSPTFGLAGDVGVRGSRCRRAR